MAQLQLPVFPEGVTQLSNDLGVSCRAGRVSYFYGALPVFTHDAKDLKSFRMFTSQLYLDGKVKQSTLVKVFGVSAISIKRAVELSRYAANILQHRIAYAIPFSYGRSTDLHTSGRAAADSQHSVLAAGRYCCSTLDVSTETW